MAKKYEYVIRQCPMNTSYCFRSFDEAKGKWSIHDYVRVYSGEIEGETINEALEKLFVKFNVGHPVDYHGRSLSVSDVVWIGKVNEDGKRKGQFYYCDSFGWSECPTKRA